MIAVNLRKSVPREESFLEPWTSCQKDGVTLASDWPSSTRGSSLTFILTTEEAKTMSLILGF
jgi:hypothetical protein